VKKQITACGDWILDRLAMDKVWNQHMAQYYAPKNFNFWYFLFR